MQHMIQNHLVWNKWLLRYNTSFHENVLPSNEVLIRLDIKQNDFLKIFLSMKVTFDDLYYT